jgi:hypothetical protein
MPPKNRSPQIPDHLIDEIRRATALHVPPAMFAAVFDDQTSRRRPDFTNMLVVLEALGCTDLETTATAVTCRVTAFDKAVTADPRILRRIRSLPDDTACMMINDALSKSPLLFEGNRYFFSVDDLLLSFERFTQPAH